MDKISKDGESQKVKSLKEIKNLPRDLADAAKGLCRKILRYKGKFLAHGLRKTVEQNIILLLLYNET